MKSLCKEANPRKEQKLKVVSIRLGSVKFIALARVNSAACDIFIRTTERAQCGNFRIRKQCLDSQKYHGKEKLKYFTVWLSCVEKTLP